MISIVVPAYNEEKRIAKTIESYANFFGKTRKQFEIIVVCDGCTDNTSSIVRKIASKNKKVKLLTFPTKLGKGGAILRGFEASKGELLGFTDADEAVAPSDFYAITLKLKDFDCVIASRRIKRAVISVKQPFQRRVASKAFNIFLNVLFGLGISDTQCGAKAMRREAYESIKDKMKSAGFEFDAELLWRIKKAGFSIHEHPISWKHTQDSKFSLTKGPGMLRRIILVRFG